MNRQLDYLMERARGRRFSWWGVVLIWVVFIVLAYFALRLFWQSSDLVFKYDWGWSLFDWQKTWQGIVSSWNDLYLGEKVAVNAAWLPAAIMVLLATLLKLSVALFLKLGLAGLLVVAGVGMTFLLKDRGVPRWAALLLGVVYAFSPTFFIRLIVGFIFYLLAFALAPWLVRYWFKHNEGGKTGWPFFIVPILFAISTAQPQFAVMLGLFFLIDWLLSPTAAYRRRALGLIIFCLATALVVHLPWLYLLFRGGAGQATTANALGGSLGTISSIPHSLLRTLIGADHHITFPIFDRLLGERGFLLAGFGLVALALLAPVVSRRREVRIFLLLLAIAWPLALGPQLPTKELFTWLYAHLPFANLFREVYHWSWLIIFSLVLLAGLALSRIKTRWLAVLATVLLLVGVFFWTKPYQEGRFYNYISTQKIPDAYQEIVAKEKNDVDHLQRTFFLPSLGFVKFTADKTPGAINSDVFATSTNRSQLPFSSSLLDFPTPAQALRNAALVNLQGLPGSNPAALAGYLRAAAVSTVIDRPTLESEFTQLFTIPKSRPELKPVWNSPKYETLLAGQTDLQKVRTEPGVVEYQVKNPQPLFSFAEQPVLAAGSWETVTQRNGDAVFYLEDLTTAQQATLKDLPATGDEQELLAAEVKEYDLLPHFTFDAAVTPADGWVRPPAVWWWQTALATTKDSYLFTSQSQPLTTTVTAPMGESRLMVKYWRGRLSQTLTIKLGAQEFVLPTATSGDGEWAWQDLGAVSLAGQSVKVTVSGQGETGIAQLLLVPKDKWEENQTVWQGRTVNHTYEATGQTDLLTVVRQDANHFQITAKSDQPRILLARMGYDPGWVLKTKQSDLKPIPAEGYAMAFVLPAGETNGDLLFAPQKAYTDLLIVAATYMAALLVLALVYR